MRCKSCDYPLWNLKARQCPECGVAFSPADYEFVINSVRFCCPHCDQSYYGTGLKGHLVPQEFNCVQCGRRVSMNDMVLRPAAGVEEQQTQVGVMPWLKRQEMGWWKAWFKTIGAGMTTPHRLMRAVPKDGTGDAWWYATATMLLALAAGAAIPCLVIAALMLITGEDASELLITAPIALIGGTLSLLLMMLMWTATAHLMLKITGGCSYPINRTLQAFLYSAGTFAPMGIPCIGPYCGGYVLWIWYAVSAIFMVADGQRVHGGRATLAVLTFPVVSGVLFVGAYVLLMFAIVSSMNTSRAAWNPTTISETQTMTQALLTYAQSRNGQLPTHALELVPANSFGTTNFISANSSTIEEDVPVGDSTLDTIESLPPNKQRMTIQSAADALPTNVIAHRVGDFVFTYHGMNLNTADPNLWIVIFSPDPDAVLAGESTGAAWAVGTAGGATLPMAGTPALLKAQNQLRARYNLPPLPDPATVTHSNPAVPGQPRSSLPQSATDGDGEDE